MIIKKYLTVFVTVFNQKQLYNILQLMKILLLYGGRRLHQFEKDNPSLRKHFPRWRVFIFTLTLYFRICANAKIRTTLILGSRQTG